jgi:hypothetical protein
MQLHICFSALLTTLVALSCQNVDALPTKRSSAMVTLPLKRVYQTRNDIHPQVVGIKVYRCPLARIHVLLAFIL